VEVVTEGIWLRMWAMSGERVREQEIEDAEIGDEEEL
jgi:hypothetical protein